MTSNYKLTYYRSIFFVAHKNIVIDILLNYIRKAFIFNFFFFFVRLCDESPSVSSVHLCVHLSVCVQNTSFCRSAGGGITSHLVTALSFVNGLNLLVETKGKKLREKWGVIYGNILNTII